MGNGPKDPSNLLNAGVIVVTFNYRLGVFGMLKKRMVELRLLSRLLNSSTFVVLPMRILTEFRQIL